MCRSASVVDPLGGGRVSDNTKIQWTEATWNPVTGCDRVSPGCDHCYAMTLAKRLKAMGSAKYQVDGNPATSGPGFGVSIHPNALSQPLRWRAPKKVFVNSMSDLFHDQVPDEYISKVFAVMAQAGQHTFQVLTKRHGRMRSLLRPGSGFAAAVLDQVGRNEIAWPLPNVWLGVSAENQKWADIRIPALLDTTAAVRFVSAEPLLGPIDLRRATATKYESQRLDAGQLDWVIVGGESGPGARLMHPEWARSLRDQCRTFDIAFHFKQWGTHGGTPKSARTLDGRTWDQFPDAE